MATANYTARVKENGSLDIPQETQEKLGIKPGDSLHVLLCTEEPNAPDLPSVIEGESLADFLGDFIGCVEGSGANNSDNTGEKFTEYLVKKHGEGHL